VPFIRAADDAAPERARGTCPASGNVLVDALAPAELAPRLALELPDEGRGRDGLLDLVRRMLRFSVNTWDQGFLDKLYASTTPVSGGP
jgi:glutamate decarboxylase